MINTHSIVPHSNTSAPQPFYYNKLTINKKPPSIGIFLTLYFALKIKCPFSKT